MKRGFFWIVMVVLPLLSGCSLLGHYYVLSHPSKVPTSHPLPRIGTIGVDRVEMPTYLFKREVAVADSQSEVHFLSDAVWAEDIDAGVTRRLISYLQRRFNQPDVHAYPWEFIKQPDIRLKVQISRFIAQGEQVYLDASWEAVDLKHQRRVAKLFRVAIPTSSSSTEIVTAMDSALAKLEEDIAKGMATLRYKN